MGEVPAFNLGDKVIISGVKVYTVTDRMKSIREDSFVYELDKKLLVYEEDLSPANFFV